MITLCVFTHGRYGYLSATLESFFKMTTGPVTNVIINDDSRNPKISTNDFKLNNPTIESFRILQSRGFGFAGAIANVWEWLYISDWYQNPFIFHLEDDFIFNRKVDLWEMMGLLDSQPHLAQLALMRQPWNQAEKMAGSLYKVPGFEFEQKQGKYRKHRIELQGDDTWVEHNNWFTTNPCMYRRELVKEFDWPLGDQSEGIFTAKLREAGYRFGYLGTLEDEPWVTHIGSDRGDGHGY